MYWNQKANTPSKSTSRRFGVGANMHNWISEEFTIGEWDGYTTCLQSYKCKNCHKVLTIPETNELCDDTVCVKKPDLQQLKRGNHAMQRLQSFRRKANGTKKNEKRHRMPSKGKCKKHRST